MAKVGWAGLNVMLTAPQDPRGVVIVADGSGDSHFTEGDSQVARTLLDEGFAVVEVRLLPRREAAARSVHDAFGRSESVHEAAGERESVQDALMRWESVHEAALAPAGKAAATATPASRDASATRVVVRARSA